MTDAELSDIERESGGNVPSSDALSYNELRCSVRQLVPLLGGKGGGSTLEKWGKNHFKNVISCNELEKCALNRLCV